LVAGESSAEGDAKLGLNAVTRAGETLDPLAVADVLLTAIEAGTFFALPHPEVGAMYARKAADTDHWVTGMQRFRSSLES
jgi:hypothetical protein